MGSHDSNAVPDQRSEWIRSPRRLRVRFGGEIIADSAEMMLLRQHGFLPVYYFPEAHVRTELFIESPHTTYSPYKGTASYFDIRVGDRVAEAAAWTYRQPLAGSPPTTGHFSFHWHAMDAWFEEDEVMAVHARDPYLRAETLRSSRHVVVRLGGEVVADTRRPVLLLETGLVTRYYIPPADVRLELFEPSTSYTMCPYKGTAQYRTFSYNGLRIEDAAWYYSAPLRDVVKITGHLCFWNERPHTSIEVDGAVLPRLGIRRTEAGGELLYPARRFFAVPPPATMRGAAPGALQHDFSRPNGRSEGPSDELIDMEVERAGGRRPPWAVPPGGREAEPAEPAEEEPAEGERAEGEQADTGLFFTFGRTGARHSGVPHGDRGAGSSSPPDPGARQGVAPSAITGESLDVSPGEPVDLAPARVCERSLRRVRVVFAGTTVADSRAAILHVGRDGVPTYWFPMEDVGTGVLSRAGEPGGAGDPGGGAAPDSEVEAGTGGKVELYEVGSGRGRARGAARRLVEPPPELAVLEGLFAFDWDAADAWFEEDDEVWGQPRVPYHRVDAEHSSRHVIARLAGRTLAESRRCVAVFETGEPARFYVPRLAVEKDLLVDGKRRTASPYLGKAHWFGAVVDGVLHDDVAWTYGDPVPECPKIADLICFDERRVEVSVDPPAFE